MNSDRLTALRGLMMEREIDIYVIPTADFHESEYVGEYFKARKYMTGFTGSAGVAVVTMKTAGLWTDGRYFIQAEKQLQGSGFDLYRMAEPGVPTVDEFIEKMLPENGVIGFDGRVINAAWGIRLQKIAEKAGGRVYVSEDLVDIIWDERPALSAKEAWILKEEYAGESCASKLERVREVMKKERANVLIMTSLDDIAWLLNVRGDDAVHFPIVLSYLVMTMKGCIWYVNQNVLNSEMKEYLAKNRVSVADYDDIYMMADRMAEKSMGRVMMDMSKVNYRIYRSVVKANEIVNRPNPTIAMKAVKNPVEVENTILAHIKDGIAMTKWIYWLKKNVASGELTEATAADKLEDFRCEQDHFLDISFDTISAYQENGAMMHYKAEPETAAVIKPEGFLLVDSGGHYLEGSTDITRTIVVGPITDKQKELFTVVLRSCLNLANAKFQYGCTGQNLDILARGPLWEMGLDYRCGTGHGVGYLLNIHEAPNGFRWRHVPERNDSAVLEAGMITTDEPGVYLEGEFGIRTENELLCRKAEETEYGRFMRFQCITFCPIDLEAVDRDAMTRKERQLLNDYHKMVWETISPYLTEEERLWLRYETREI